MKKNLLLFLFVPLISAGQSYAFDIKGLQPLAPYGVYSTFSAESLKESTSGIAIGIERSNQPNYNRFIAQFAYGIKDNIEIDLTIPYITDWNGSADNLEDVSLGLKHRVIDEDRYGPAIAYILNISFPTGKKDLTTEGSFGGGLIISKKVGPVYGHVNLLYSRPGTNRFKDDVTIAAGIDFSASNNFKILSELYGKKGYSGRLDNIEWRFGYRLQTTENIYTTVGAGIDIKNSSPEYRLMLSLTYLFRHEAANIKRIYERED